MLKTETLLAMLKRTFLKGMAITLSIQQENGKLSVELVIWAVAVVLWLFVLYGE